MSICLNCRKEIPRHSPYKTFCKQSCYDTYTVAETVSESMSYIISAMRERNRDAVEKELREENKVLRIENAELRVIIEKLK